MPKFHSRKYQLNEEFFSNWSPNMAYVLGFWWADGYMVHNRSYKIRFFSNDLEILEKIRTVMASTNPIVELTGMKNGKPTHCRELAVYSKRLFHDLTAIGGIRNKSRVLVFPKIPPEYDRDFIRGYFDGDGSVHEITYKATKNGKIYTNIRSNFTSGTKSFLEKLNYFFSRKLGLSKKVIGQYGPYQFKLGYGEQDTYQLLKFMYYPKHEVSMSRKVEYLQKIENRIKNYAFSPKFSL